MSAPLALLSIGGLSRVSGIGVETLRNWERRYGFPEPVRLDSGHRRYPSETVPRLRLVRRALDLGLKPSFALAADPEELEAMIRKAESESSQNSVAAETEFDAEIANWMAYTERLDPVGLEQLLLLAWTKWGARSFIMDLAIPFLHQVGDRWFEKSISVAHEHFAAENLTSFLSGQWRPIARRARGGKAVAANLPGDFHQLGIQMAAVFLALSDFEVVFLGPNTPVAEIILAAKEPSVVTAVIGLCSTSDTASAIQAIARIREAVPASVTLVAGGNDDLPEIRGVTRLESMADFAEFVRSLSEIYRG